MVMYELIRVFDFNMKALIITLLVFKLQQAHDSHINKLLDHEMLLQENSHKLNEQSLL